MVVLEKKEGVINEWVDGALLPLTSVVLDTFLLVLQVTTLHELSRHTP